ncbi:hypothetical protein B0A48_10097 [Cryoendolithus antarcticus]|uniref:Uncharacterized protein n=1 Tax=Cryoendolithus antarcticus TaxID=1507870 RepID=A0A1V8SWK0_9PEZI|nr:hypothetical protein B0A48_10097 [Cryoendolithus antarcticus]
MDALDRLTARHGQGTQVCHRLPPPVGILLHAIDIEHLANEESAVQVNLKISDCKLLASYNWAGLPALWKPLTGATQIPQDAGEYFKDTNAANYPAHPLEPAVAAALGQAPGLDTGQGEEKRGEEKTFRFLVEAVGRTVFFVRRANAPDEMTYGPSGYGANGHGHTFPEHSQDFTDMKLVVPSGADGFLGEKTLAGEEDASVASESDLSNIAGRKVRRGAYRISQHQIFDLKTHGMHKKDDDHVAGHIPRLWLAQIPNFNLAFHEWGLFSPENVSIRDIRADIQQWETDNVDLLGRFKWLLDKLISWAHDPEFGKYGICCHTAGRLETRCQGGKLQAPLSDGLARSWLEHTGIFPTSD